MEQKNSLERFILKTNGVFEVNYFGQQRLHYHLSLSNQHYVLV